MTEERKHEIESIIDNALTDEDCKEWAAGNMTDNVSELVKKFNIKQLNIWDDVCEIVEFYPETIKRESTWDYDDQDGKLTYAEYHVETIETWEWSDELNRYVLVYLEEKKTGRYIPYNEHDYISNGAVTIPTLTETRKEQIERETREFLCKVLVETYDIKPENAEDYICEFFWHKNCLYTSIDKLRNPTLTATMKKGVLF